MKHSRVGLLIFIAVSLSAGIVAFWSDHEDRSQPSPVQPVSPLFAASFGISTSTRPPPAEAAQPRIAAAPKPLRSSTAMRAAILDSDDIVATALKIKASGTPDQKFYAAEALTSCHLHVHADSISTPESVRLQLAEARALSRREDTPEIRAMRDEAETKLNQQCFGFIGMAVQKRLELIQSLKSGAGPLPGQALSARQTLTYLDARLRNGDTRWSTAEAESVSNSLHGDDAVLRRDAFLLLYGSIDRKAPGGKERREALFAALGNEMAVPRLSTLESRESCIYLGWCGTGFPSVPTGENPAVSAETARLSSLYRDAFEKRLPYGDIMSIR